MQRHFAADARGARLAIGHDAVRRRDDGDAEARSSRAECRPCSCRCAAPGFDTRSIFSMTGRPGVVLERDLQHRLHLVAGNLERIDVALVLQDPAIASLTLDDGIATTACSTICALRMRVSMSAIGSVMLIYLLRQKTRRERRSPAGLDDAGISPRIANSRSLLRDRPNLRKEPARPAGHRAAAAQPRRIGVARQLLQLERARSGPRRRPSSRPMIASSAARFFAYFFTSARRFWSRLIRASFAMVVLQFLNGK
jgi:hypothetical protein